MAMIQRMNAAGPLLALCLAACASGGGGGGEPNPPASSSAGSAAGATATLPITIINDHAAAGNFVLFIEAVGGVRQSLGTVQPGTSPTFRFAASRGTAYVLIQQTDTGETRTSEQFTYSDPTRVSWDMNTRRLAVQRR